MSDAPQCLSREAPDVRQRLRAALRAKQQSRRSGGKLRQINSALASLNMDSASNLREAQKRLAATQKKLVRSSRPTSSETLKTEYIDDSPLPAAAAETAPSVRQVLRAPTE